MKTIIVRRGNKRKTVVENVKAKYLADGFDVIDEKGNIKERGNKPTNKLVKELEDKNKKLVEENKKLQKEIEKLKK